MINRAQEMRNKPTDAERALWRQLRLRQMAGYEFRGQQPIGPFIVDFICLEKRRILEVDGGQHAERVEADEEQTAWLEGQGFRVLRFWNNEVLTQMEAVAEDRKSTRLNSSHRL